MPLTLTSEQILALAPDDSSRKAGKELSSTRKWALLGQNEQALWGECQGSGKTPYQTSVDLSEPAFRCSCPSRKFPCKHGLGLLLLAEAQPAAVSQSEAPAWVAEWLASRSKRGEQRAKREERGEPVVDPAGQAKRAAEREAKVAAGVSELGLWLQDLARRGLASVQTQSYSFWEGPAARMVDAQAPGLARMVREMAGIAASGEGWQERLLERLGRLHLLIEAYGRRDVLPAETRADVRSLVGWSQSQEEILAQPGVTDHWLVLGRRVEEEERLRVQRTWLLGQDTGRPALLLQFAVPPQPLDPGFIPGTRFEGELAFYPSAWPVRALVKSRGATVGVEEPPGYTALLAATAAYAEALARYPWIERFPLPLREVVPVRAGSRWTVVDADGHAAALAGGFDRGWELLALSGGHPIWLFGEWDGDALLPLSARAEDRFRSLA